MAEKFKEITSAQALEKCVGKTPGPRDLKVIDFLDKNAQRWVSASPCLFVSVFEKESGRVRALIAGGKPGFIKAETNQLIIPLDSVDEAGSLSPGDGWGCLFIIPSLRESLRVNGRVSSVTSDSITVQVAECYLHCAKAFMRSKLWQEYDTKVQTISAETDFCRQTRFMLVATSDSEANADLSPKGDPAGKLLCLNDGYAFYPDRPGNRRVDGFRNLLTNPGLEILALIAGSNQVLRLNGQAVLYSEHPIKTLFDVKNKAPHLVVRVDFEKMTIEESPALKRANLWPPVPPEADFKASEIWKEHARLSKVSGLEAVIAKTAVSVPGVLEKGLDWDYKNNLY